jgi:hypothetical protein
VVFHRHTLITDVEGHYLKFQAVDIVEVIELSWSDEAHPKVV